MCSFIFTNLLVRKTNATISKNPFLFFSQFSPPIPPLLVQKIILTIPTNITFLYTSAIFCLPLFAYNHPNNLHQKHFPYLNHLDCVKGPGVRECCEDWHCFNLSLLAQSMGSDNRAHNHWFFVAQTQTIGVLQAWQTILSTSTYCHYFHILLIPRQELTFP